ncbi:hypothetical protein CGCSCA5_v010351 [Colletotrichum siamense]|nr:hypothetical protein CGCSCA5_v010351 [Colletotrichum siamense]
MVRQAIALTSLVGQRYLWVDTLCIDHSRIAESTTQLQNMGAIYANASLTIVALDRDAEDGFPSLRDISREKYRDDEVPIQFGNEQFILDKLSYFGLTSWSMYHERGWTFQEFNMSPRRLIFSKDLLHWVSNWAMAKEVELIAICRARGYKQTFNVSIGCYTAPFTSWEVYSVLWVEWIDGVAHRLACGEVDKTSWEELALEDVSLILG